MIGMSIDGAYTEYELKTIRSEPPVKTIYEDDKAI